MSPAGESPEYLGFMVHKAGRGHFIVLKGVGVACQLGAPCLQSRKIHTYFKIPHHSASVFSSLDEMYDVATFKVATS